MTPAGQRSRVRWYHVPVLWVGILALAGSVIGCIVTVAVAMQHADSGLADSAPGGRFQMAPLEESRPDAPR